MRTIGVGLLGVGTVGGGVATLVARHRADLEARLGARLEIVRAAVRDRSRARPPELDASVLTTDAREVLADDRVEIVVELIGGVEPARELVLGALARGKHVVTANKKLLAEAGAELFAAATKANVDLLYEAAVCGGIPIIRTLREALASDRVSSVVGIVNGTTNFILGRMADEGASFEAALKEAQRLGFAEADPTADVEGHDAAAKLTLLAALAFGARLSPAMVATEGITKLAPIDHAYAKDFGLTVKLLAIARRVAGGATSASESGAAHSIELRVAPAMVPSQSLLAGVRGAFNAVLVRCDALGPIFLHGQGAGALPTASAVVADLVELGRTLGQRGVGGRVPHLAYQDASIAETPALAVADSTGTFYVRFTVVDEPGVLARLAGSLGARGVSIASLVQREHTPLADGGGEPVAVVVVTHEARERAVRAAVAEIDALPFARAPTRVVRIERALEA